MKLRFVLFFGLLFIFSANLSADVFRYTDERGVMFYWSQYKDMGAVGLYEYTLLTFHKDSAIEIGTPYFSINAAQTGSEWLYSFKGPQLLLSYHVARGLTSLTYDDSTRYYETPYRYILSLPNMFIHYKLYKNLKLIVGTDTEYLFYRTHHGRRGILFYPYVGINISGGYHTYWNGISFYVGHAHFLNFDSGNPHPQLLFGISVFLTDFPH